MTNRTIPECAEKGFRADLQHQEGQAHRASILLRHAADAVEHEQPGEPTADRAQRLRGAAVLAQSAALELAVTCGWLEATHAAAQHELVEVKS